MHEFESGPESNYLAVLPPDELPDDHLCEAAIDAADDLADTADKLHDHGWFVAEHRCRKAAQLMRATARRLAGETAGHDSGVAR